MKALIAAACVAVIAATGYYFVQEYRGHVAAVAEAERIEGVRAELFHFANTMNPEGARKFCSNLERLVPSADKAAMVRQLVTNCRALGYL